MGLGGMPEGSESAWEERGRQGRDGMAVAACGAGEHGLVLGCRGLRRPYYVFSIHPSHMPRPWSACCWTAGPAAGSCPRTYLRWSRWGDAHCAYIAYPQCYAAGQLSVLCGPVGRARAYLSQGRQGTRARYPVSRGGDRKGGRRLVNTSAFASPRTCLHWSWCDDAGVYQAGYTGPDRAACSLRHADGDRLPP